MPRKLLLTTIFISSQIVFLSCSGNVEPLDATGCKVELVAPTTSDVFSISQRVPVEIRLDSPSGTARPGHVIISATTKAGILLGERVCKLVRVDSNGSQFFAPNTPDNKIEMTHVGEIKLEAIAYYYKITDPKVSSEVITEEFHSKALELKVLAKKPKVR